jgi:hypothetical protein
MIFVIIDGFVTVMCASLILAIPAAVNKVFQVQDIDIGLQNAGQKLDNQIGNSNTVQTTANVGNLTKAQNVLGGTDYSSSGGNNSGQKARNVDSEDQAPHQLLHNTTDVPFPKTPQPPDNGANNKEII